MVFLLKNWKSILDVILVIALVLLFFIWNPFGIFGGGLQLRPTANLVTEIKEMGQLITSEYYGEVIASMEEARMNYLEEEAVAEKASRLYDQLYDAMSYLHDFQSLEPEVREAQYQEMGLTRARRKIIRSKVSRSNILEKLNDQDLLEDFSYEPLYGDILEYVWTSGRGNRSWEGTPRQKEDALMLLYSRAANNQEEDLQESAFMQFYYAKKHTEQSKKELRKKLAIVGRGWVKAGFDFSKLDNTNFYVNEEAGEVHFFGFSATILNSDINPWFIPELGIPGFEILDYNGKVDFKDAQTLKLHCIDKLVVKAREADILQNAERNGAEILKNLFSLLTGKDIKKVFFHHDDIIQFSKAIAEDEYISYHEAVLLDFNLAKERDTIDSLLNTKENSYKNNQLANHREENIRQILGSLYTLPFEDYPGHFNKLSTMAYEIARDSIIDRYEWESIKAARTPSLSKNPQPRIPSLEDSLSHAAEYNMLLTYLLQREVKPGMQTDSIIIARGASASFFTNRHVYGYDWANEDSLKVYFTKDTASADQIFLSLFYPYLYKKLFWEKLMSKDKLILDSLPLSSMDSLAVTDSSTTLLYVGKPVPHLKRLHIPPNQWIEPFLLEHHQEDGILRLSPDLYIIRKPTTAESLSKPDSTLLSPTQGEEIEAFYGNLLKLHAEQKEIGPVVRANQWVQKKFENNTSLPEWFSKLKTKLFD